MNVLRAQYSAERMRLNPKGSQSHNIFCGYGELIRLRLNWN